MAYQAIVDDNASSWINIERTSSPPYGLSKALKYN